MLRALFFIKINFTRVGLVKSLRLYLLRGSTLKPSFLLKKEFNYYT
jgi:hypothetical protein